MRRVVENGLYLKEFDDFVENKERWRIVTAGWPLIWSFENTRSTKQDLVSARD